MATQQQKETWLSEAETALHELQTGKRLVSCNYNGRTVTYGQADASKLQAYVNQLQIELGLKCGRSKPLRPMF